MADYLFRLEVPADKRSFTVAEALDTTSQVLHPDPRTDQPVMILSIDKVERRPVQHGQAGRPTALTDADWERLRLIWSRLDAPDFPMSAVLWQTYLDAFNSSRNRPQDWDLNALQRDPELQATLKRAVAMQEHRDILKRAIDAREITLRNPLSGAVSEIGWVGNSDSWLLTLEQFKTLCDRVSIELVVMPHFTSTAWPRTVPADLLVLDAKTRITHDENIAGVVQRGVCGAGEYCDAIKAQIARQEDGFFTLNEAAQILTDSRPELDPQDTVKRFRLAHSKRGLPIHQGGSRFLLEVGEVIRDFFDLLSAGELDAWLRASAGYGFPPAADIAGRTEVSAAAASKATVFSRGRRLKRAALIAENCTRWVTIERDLKDAAENGLSEAAKDKSVGWWWEDCALEWARARAKIAEGPPLVLPGLQGIIHRMKG